MIRPLLSSASRYWPSALGLISLCAALGLTHWRHQQAHIAHQVARDDAAHARSLLNMGMHAGDFRAASRQISKPSSSPAPSAEALLQQAIDSALADAAIPPQAMTRRDFSRGKAALRRASSAPPQVNTPLAPMQTPIDFAYLQVDLTLLANDAASLLRFTDDLIARLPDSTIEELSLERMAASAPGTPSLRLSLRLRCYISSIR